MYQAILFVTLYFTFRLLLNQGPNSYNFLRRWYIKTTPRLNIITVLSFLKKTPPSKKQPTTFLRRPSCRSEQNNQQLVRMSVYTCAALLAAVVMLVAGKPTGWNLVDDVDFITNGGEGSGKDLVLPAESLYKSAFTAKLTTGLDASWYENRRIVFDSVLTSVGNDYNPKDGRFTTSISGTYVFSLSLMSKYSSGSSAFGCLQKNDIEQICVWSNGNSAHEMSSNTITLNLKKGDVVNVVLKAGSNYGLHNYGEAGYCSFSGFLLYPEKSPLDKILAAINIS